MKRNITCAIFALIIMSSLIMPVGAVDPTPLATYSPIETLVPTIDIDPFNPLTDHYLRFWWEGQNSTLTMNAFGFLYQFIYPFSQFMGDFFYLTIFAIWLFCLWTRARGIEIVLIGILATGAVWGMLLPADSQKWLLLILAMAISAILFRLFKKK